MPHIDSIMPINVSGSRVSIVKCKGETRPPTSTDDLLLNPPLANDGKQEGQRVHDWHRQAQLCAPLVCRSCQCSATPRSKHEAQPHEKREERTGFPNQQEEPHTPRQIQHQRHCIRWVAQQVRGREEGGVDTTPEGAGAHGGRVERRVRRWVAGARCAPDEWRGQAPGQADEEEAEDVVGCWDVGLRGWGGGGGCHCAMGEGKEMLGLRIQG